MLGCTLIMGSDPAAVRAEVERRLSRLRIVSVVVVVLISIAIALAVLNLFLFGTGGDAVRNWVVVLGLLLSVAGYLVWFRWLVARVRRVEAGIR